MAFSLICLFLLFGLQQFTVVTADLDYFGYQNCAVLDTGYNVHWTANSTINEIEILLEYQSSIPWVAFGINPGCESACMIGIDHSLTFWIAGESSPRLYDMFISGASACSTSNNVSTGVCSDTLTSGFNSLTLLGGAVDTTNNASYVRYKRNLTASDSSDKAFNVTDGSTLFGFAYGSTSVTFFSDDTSFLNPQLQFHRNRGTFSSKFLESSGTGKCTRIYIATPSGLTSSPTPAPTSAPTPASTSAPTPAAPTPSSTSLSSSLSSSILTVVKCMLMLSVMKKILNL